MENKIVKPEDKKNIIDNKKTDKNASLSMGYRKRLFRLKRTIFFGVFVAIIFIGVIGGIFNYYLNLKNDNDIEIKQLQVKIEELKSSNINLNAKITDGKKYKEVWKIADKRKKSFDGFKANEVNDLFNKMALVYNIGKPSITISVPQVLTGGVYDRKSLNVLQSSVAIQFTAVDDISAMAFSTEFMNSLPGYMIISDFSISKAQDYTEGDLVDISKGKFDTGKVSANIIIDWYVFKTKENANSTTNNASGGTANGNVDNSNSKLKNSN